MLAKLVRSEASLSCAEFAYSRSFSESWPEKVVSARAARRR